MKYLIFNVFPCLVSSYHRCIIDTSYIFQLTNEPNSIPSLRDISESYLGTKLNVIHDSVQDAQAAMMIVNKVFVNGLPQSIGRGVPQEQCNLLVHRIPANCTTENISQLFITNTFIVPTKVHPIITNTQDNAAAGKSTVTFESAKHADLAFETLAGPNRPDKSNRPQKRVYLKGGGYMCVRKF
jgi:hypothetical protein